VTPETPQIEAVLPAGRDDPVLFEGLVELLRDVVDGGASVGFLAPLSRESAGRYWRDILDSLGPSLLLWVAREDDRVVGTVQLAPSPKANAPHRADLQKLMVRTSHRGRNLSTRLMQTAEGEARRLGRTLLVLDTEKASAAERIYQRWGWQRAGEIPDFALTPRGALHPTVYYYKRLG
jgi:GNAT superfamily N-acetyltransferase